jgi:hypothetical protein
MLDKLLPRTIDNTYRGYKAALWFLGLITAVRVLQSMMIIFNGSSTIKGADGIPLDSYEPEAALTIMALFAQNSLWRLLFCLLSIIVLVWYRSAVSLMFTLLLLHYLAARLLSQFVPLVREGTLPPGSVVNLTLFALMFIGLVLSLRNRGVST